MLVVSSFPYWIISLLGFSGEYGERRGCHYWFHIVVIPLAVSPLHHIFVGTGRLRQGPCCIAHSVLYSLCYTCDLVKGFFAIKMKLVNNLKVDGMSGSRVFKSVFSST